MADDITEELEVDLEPVQTHFEGVVKIPPGKMLEDIFIEGIGVLRGDFETDNLRVDGILKAKGDLVLHGDLTVNGICTCKGKLICEQEVTVSGMTRIHDTVKVEDTLHVLGTFKGKNQIQVGSVVFEGAASINGDIVARKLVKVGGRAKINGNIVGGNIHLTKSEEKTHLFALKSIIKGNIAGKNIVALNHTKVFGDVKGKIVNLGIKTRILGRVYYVEDIVISPRVKLASDPIQISLEELLS
jgi:cytoskeletal protein CcmA (bactofilin family)